MKIPVEKRDWRRMSAMFTTIAPSYDFFTRFFSYGMDRHWKKVCVTRAVLPENPLVLDLASGTGDFSLLVAGRYPGARTVAVDLTERMLQLARGRGVARAVCADAESLPFPDASFDGVFIGYGLRNFRNLEAVAREIERVTRPGGLLASLDFFLPANRWLRRVYLGWLYAQGAFFGQLLHGQPRVYTYIPDSLRTFVSIDEFSALLRRAGYGAVGTRRFVLGGIGLHWAAKRSSRERPPL
jgi:demethylmenaquinone methyltransferase/2-methoxy-6-polyprenyl-1,4-benzoquinol methylase